MPRQELLENFFSSVVKEGIHPGRANLQFYLEYLFDSVPLVGRSVLDIGSGAGTVAFYARCAGAEGVVCLEPEKAGSNAGMRDSFRAMEARLGLSGVRLESTTFQDFQSRGETFDVIVLHDSINHLDEQACIALRRNAAARARYEAIFNKLALLSRRGAAAIVTDCSRHNFFNLLAVRNPIVPNIDWHKHQSPRVWAGLLSEAGFGRPRIRWRAPSSLRWVGRALLGNALASFFLDSQFCLTMIKM